ncbi:cytochrome P450 [Xylariaceae sp. FL1019]|nr:cytochrome P450 [Xylariaceae sp. FL1019]
MSVTESLTEAFSLRLIVAQVLIAFLSLLVYRRYFSPISDIPGPFFASIGRLWHTKQIIGRKQSDVLLQLHDELGPFVRIANNEVSVCHPRGSKEILLNPLPKDKWYSFFQIPDYRFDGGMSILEPKRKAEHSKHFASGYALSNLLKSEDHMDTNIGSFLDWMDKHAASGEPMDFGLFLTFTANDVLGEVLFSKTFGFLKEGKDIDNAVRNNHGLALYAAIAGHHWLFMLLHKLFIANPVVTWLNVVPAGHIMSTAVQWLEHREKNTDARFDMVEHWFKAMREQPDRVSFRQVQCQTTGTIGGGADTISAGIQSFVYHALRRPSVWARARSEIDDLRAGGLCQDRVVSYAHTQKLPYLLACIKEALRIFPPAPLGLPRVAPKGGVTIGDRTFPEGTILSISPYVVHRSKALWGEDVNEYKPERWLSGDTAALDRNYVAFGLGFNSCPGQHLARIEMYKIAATIVRDYDIRQVNPDQAWSHDAYFIDCPYDWPVLITKRTL